MFDEINVAVLMSHDPRFPQAEQDLESTDYATFQAACVTMQSCVRDALLQLISQCSNCYDGCVCDRHQHCLDETEAMLTSEDAPVFQGIMP